MASVSSPYPYAARYTDDGFRLNSTQGPFEVVAIGDCISKIGENDRDTLTERLATFSRLAVANLGRAWYGPHQYVELLKRYGVPLHPRIALFCFFDGNDLADIGAYRTWSTTGEYYFYRDVSDIALFGRYSMAMSDIYAALKSTPRRFARGHGTSTTHPDVARVRLHNEDVSMVFHYWSPELSLDQLQRSPDFGVLQRLVTEFKDVSVAAGIVPMLVFIPTKAGVYGPLVADGSGSSVLARMPTQLKIEAVSFEAVKSLAQQLRLSFVDLRTPFRALARQGELLYYPLDTHWNSRGRQAAAEVLARALPVSRPIAPVSPDVDSGRPSQEH